MASDIVNYSLIVPSSIVVSGEADMVVCPGIEGYFGVLARMSPLISELSSGAVIIFEKRQVVKRFFITSGVLEVTPHHVTVLAEEAEDFDAIDTITTQISLSGARGKQKEILEKKAYLVSNPPYTRF